MAVENSISCIHMVSESCHCIKVGGGKWIFIANFSDLALLVADALGAPNRVDSQRGLGVIKGKI